MTINLLPLKILIILPPLVQLKGIPTKWNTNTRLIIVFITTANNIIIEVTIFHTHMIQPIFIPRMEINS
uniref:Uncharacterized protein n=1 Tax=Rhizophora mucronata TaxID=61149 RepID=A0A2P2KU76_RHIMU